MQNQMDNLANAIRMLQSGAMGRAEFFAQVDRMLTSAPGSATTLLQALSDAHSRAALPTEVFAEAERHIAQALETRHRLQADDTYVQTKPGEPAPPRPGAQPERVKGVGDTLNGRFVLEECVGFGGMGTVYKALDLRKLEASDRKPYIAIKVLNVQFQGHPKSLIALQREARKAQTLAHPNIVAVYDFDRDGSMVYLTMEYLQGKPLSQVLRAPNFGGMPYADAMRIVNGMGKALAYAHERGFVHCDFKPANVILTDSGGVKVIDFGIARVFQKAEEEADVTVFDPGSLGALTPAYASPEMIEGREPDPRDDIYALACMTYELLTGHHPFNRMSAVQARDAGLRPQRPARLGFRQWRALRCALAFDRNARTASVEQFLHEMGASTPRRSSMTVVVVLAVLVLGGAASLFFLRPSGAPTAEEAPQPAPAVEPPAPSPAAPVQAQQAPPQPAPPVLTLPAVSAALAKVPCSALLPALQAGTVRVQGYLGRGYGLSRLRNELASLPGAAGVEVSVQELDDNKCPVMEVLGRYWVAHRMSSDAASIRLNPQSGKGGKLVEGDTLMVDITSPGYQSYVTVDYFVLDGGVVHLLPSPSARENLAPPRYTATVGSLGNWVISKPFGNEMLVMVATPVPLFEGLRPEIEPGRDYLRALDARLAQISKSHGSASVAVEFLQISTHARR